nr:hypothetical protein [Paramuribaculum sp.]
NIYGGDFRSMDVISFMSRKSKKKFNEVTLKAPKRFGQAGFLAKYITLYYKKAVTLHNNKEK